jgi:hypothetical protein
MEVHDIHGGLSIDPTIARQQLVLHIWLHRADKTQPAFL